MRLPGYRFQIRQSGRAGGNQIQRCIFVQRGHLTAGRVEVENARARSGFFLEFDDQAVKLAIRLQRAGEGRDLHFLELLFQGRQLRCRYRTDRCNRKRYGSDAKMFWFGFHSWIFRFGKRGCAP